ncbi:hypothetical protein NDU88_007459 [Pleurodeles waltl]|uniref:Uncharacterized protein n=1 Tax=Pleurodeles waltl TaxID=8319 RepID=A0AAV7QPY2_PLEWA|nr:hypothetical protein NDU88_007459 [Pleurodeles waltl]
MGAGQAPMEQGARGWRPHPSGARQPEQGLLMEAGPSEQEGAVAAGRDLKLVSLVGTRQHRKVEWSGSEDGDPGGLVTGSAPWEEEKAGPVRLAGLNLCTLAGQCGPRQ